MEAESGGSWVEVDASGCKPGEHGFLPQSLSLKFKEYSGGKDLPGQTKLCTRGKAAREPAVPPHPLLLGAFHSEIGKQPPPPMPPLTLLSGLVVYALLTQRSRPDSLIISPLQPLIS